MDLSADSKLTRAQTAQALSDAGYPTAAATLATKATRGGGPPYQLYGRVPIYTWGPTLSWAESQLSAPIGSSSEARRVAAKSAPATKPAPPVADDCRQRGRPPVAAPREHVADLKRIADPVDPCA
jgi:hypothetical protein